MSTDYRAALRGHADFPKPGVRFWDTTPLLESPRLFASAIAELAAHARACGAGRIAAIEAKGFPLGGALAAELGLPLVLVRKPGLIPGSIRSAHFIKEYGEGEYAVKREAFARRDRVYLHYDILAAPGAALAAKALIEECGASLVGAGFLAELDYLGGREALAQVPVHALALVRLEDGNEHQAAEF